MRCISELKTKSRKRTGVEIAMCESGLNMTFQSSSFRATGDTVLTPTGRTVSFQLRLRKRESWMESSRTKATIRSTVRVTTGNQSNTRWIRNKRRISQRSKIGKSGILFASHLVWCFLHCRVLCPVSKLAIRKHHLTVFQPFVQYSHGSSYRWMNASGLHRLHVFPSSYEGSPGGYFPPTQVT